MGDRGNRNKLNCSFKISSLKKIEKATNLFFLKKKKRKRRNNVRNLATSKKIFKEVEEEGKER